MLNTFKNIAIYGYTANNINSKIAFLEILQKRLLN